MMTEVIVKDAARIAKLSFENGKYVARFNGRVLASSRSKEYVVGKIRSRDCSRAVELGVYDVEEEHHFVTEGTPATIEGLQIEESIEFDINTRFEFLETLVQMIVDKKTPSLLITGEGGLGKTFTVKNVLSKNGLEDVAVHAKEVAEARAKAEAEAKAAEEAAKKAAKALAKKKKGEDSEEDAKEEEDDESVPIVPATFNPVEVRNIGDFIIVKGYSTAKALYRILYENRDKICIFDDCDSIQKDQNAVNLIKAAADSYDDRWVSWYSESPFSDLPSSFRFEGQVIFISNWPYHKVDQAIRSRSMCVDLSMTADQKITRMAVIVESPEFMPEVPVEMKQEALMFLKERRHVVRDLTMRSLITTIKIRTSDAPNWAQLAEYIVRTN